MTNTRRPYTGNRDAPAKSVTPAVRRFQDYMRFYGFAASGGLNVRVMRTAPEWAKKLPPTDPRVRKYLSVHATGRAFDPKKNSPKELASWFDLMVDFADELHLEELHDYSYKAPGADRAYGRGYRCSRGGGPTKGVRIYTATNNAGSIGGRWLHVEIAPGTTPAQIDAGFKTMISALAAALAPRI